MAQQKEADRARRVQSLDGTGVQRVNYDNFHGLILLVEYNDKSFKYANYRDLMDEMANQENYTGNSITNVSSRSGICTGSVRDFYEDCSMGQFIPTFDVVGPVKIDYSQYGVNWKNVSTTVITKLMADVIEAADPLVDFSHYDADGNGVVDLVYIIFAGLGSNISGNDDRLMWPHQSDFYNPDYKGWGNPYIYKDGVRLGHYACSTELFGTKEWNTLDGIGTITHEFGHVPLPWRVDGDGRRRLPELWPYPSPLYIVRTLCSGLGQARGHQRRGQLHPAGHRWEQHRLQAEYPRKQGVLHDGEPPADEMEQIPARPRHARLPC
jgi:M6 family metalloprotease-like protein